MPTPSTSSKNTIEALTKLPKHWIDHLELQRFYEDARARTDFFGALPVLNADSEAKLDAIFSSVRQTYGGSYLNQSVLEAARAYFYQIITGHPLRDGNKRTAVLVLLRFLYLNDVWLRLSEAEMYQLAVLVAENPDDLEYREIRKRIESILQLHAFDRKKTRRASFIVNLKWFFQQKFR